MRKAAGQGDINAAVSKSQLEEMKKFAAEAFTCRVCGLSFGLEYEPGASREEVIEMAQFSLPEAVKRCTLLSARAAGLAENGRF